MGTEKDPVATGGTEELFLEYSTRRGESNHWNIDVPIGLQCGTTKESVVCNTTLVDCRQNADNKKLETVHYATSETWMQKIWSVMIIDKDFNVKMGNNKNSVQKLFVHHSSIFIDFWNKNFLLESVKKEILNWM